MTGASGRSCRQNLSLAYLRRLQPVLLAFGLLGEPSAALLPKDFERLSTIKPSICPVQKSPTKVIMDYCHPLSRNCDNFQSISSSVLWPMLSKSIADRRLLYH